MDGLKAIVGGTIMDTTPMQPKDPREMSRGEFEAWERDRARGGYDINSDVMLFRCGDNRFGGPQGVYRVEMPVRFDTEVISGIVYAMAADVKRAGKLR